MDFDVVRRIRQNHWDFTACLPKYIQRLQPSCSITSLPKNNFPAIKSFGIFVWRVGFDTPKPKERIEGIFREPLFASLCRKLIHEALHFLFTLGLRQWNKDVRLAKIAVILRYFVL